MFAKLFGSKEEARERSGSPKELHSGGQVPGGLQNLAQQAPQCSTSGCRRLTWDGKVGSACCRTCYSSLGVRHGPTCSQGASGLASQGSGDASASYPLSNALPVASAVAVASAVPVATAVAVAPIGLVSRPQPLVTPQPRPAPSLEEPVPSAPSSFPELGKLPQSQLHYLQDNSVALDDWLQELSAVTDLQERAEKARDASKDIAETLLSKEANLVSVAARSAEATAAHDKRLGTVEQLLRSRDEILDQNSPEKLSRTLAKKALMAEMGAEGCLREVLTTPGNLDAAALSAFRQRYYQQKIEKHARLALKERLERPGGA